MQVVVSDTGPINYLVLTGYARILPVLFDLIILPNAVKHELARGPRSVQDWLAHTPPWIEIRQPSYLYQGFQNLGAGERAGIAISLELRADLLLMDDRRGAMAARGNGLQVTGTLGVLTRAAKENLVDLAEAFALLRKTNFHHRRELMDALLAEAAR